MVWTIARSPATGSGTITITPDGTSHLDLKEALDSAISQGLEGISKASEVYYQIAAGTRLQLNGLSTDTAFFCYFSGIILELNDQFIREQHSRLKISNRNRSNVIVGRPQLILTRNLSFQFNQAGSLFAGRNNSFLEADSFDFLFKPAASSGGAVIGGSGLISGVSTWKNSTFHFLSNGIFYNDETAANPFDNCQFTRIPRFEMLRSSRLAGLTFNDSGDSQGTIYSPNSTITIRLEQCRFINCNGDINVRSGSSAFLADCETTPTKLRSDNNGSVTLQNVVQLIGSTTEANGVFYLRHPSASADYRRTFSSTGRIQGGNANGSQNLTNSDRIFADVARYTFTSSARTTEYNYASTPFLGVFAKYGRQPVAFSLALDGLISGSQLVPFSSIADTEITQQNAATVAVYTGISIDHVAARVKVTNVTITEAQLYDFLAHHKASLEDSGVTANGLNLPRCALPTFESQIYDRTTGQFQYNLEIDNGTITATGRRFVFSSGRSLTLLNNGSTDAIVTDDTGTSVTVTAPTLAEGTRIQLYNLSDNVELDNRLVPAGGYAFRTKHTADKSLRLKAILVQGGTAKEYVERTATLTNTGAQFTPPQIDNEFYNQIAIDGSTVAEFIPNGMNVDIDNSSINGSTLQRAYAKYIYFLSTESGIRLYKNDVIPRGDIFNFLVDAPLTFRLLDTSKSFRLTGGVIKRADGLSVISDGSPISIEPDRVYSISVAGSGGSGGLTTAQDAALTRIDSRVDVAISTIPTAVQNAAAVRTNLTAELGRIDAPITGRPTLAQIEASTVLAKSSQIPAAPDNAGIAAIKAKTDALVITSGRVDAAIDATLLAKEATVTARPTLTAIEASTVLAKSSQIPPAPDNTAIAAINNRLPASPASTADVQTTVNVSGGFLEADRSKLNSLPALTAIEASSVLAKTNELPPPPDNTAIAQAVDIVLTDNFAAIATNLNEIEAAIAALEATAGLTSQQAEQLQLLYQFRGGDPANPWLIGVDGKQTAGGVTLTVTEGSEGTIVQRQP